MSIDIVLDEEDGAKFVLIGDEPIEGDASWEVVADKVYEQVRQVIKANYEMSAGAGENSFVVDGQEFKLLPAEIDPLGVYAYDDAGNGFIEEIYALLKSELS